MDRPEGGLKSAPCGRTRPLTKVKAPCAATSLIRPDAAVSTQQSGVGAGAAAVHASLTELSLHGNELR